MNRDKIKECYKWDLKKIYRNDLEIEKDIRLVKEKSKDFSKYQEIVFDEVTLYEVLSLMMEVSRIISKLAVYANLLCDEDTSKSQSRELKERINNLNSLFTNEIYFIEPKILKMDYQKIKEFIKKNDKLKEYTRYFQELFRYKEHTLSDNEEKLLANLSKTFSNDYETYELLKDADMEFSKFRINGQEYKLDNNTYSLYIESNDRDIRKKAFKTLYKSYKQFKNVFGNLIISNIKEEVSISKIRKYKSALASSTYHDELDESICNNLIDVIHKKMSTIYKYYQLKKHVLGVDELHLYDVYANLISNDGCLYDFDQAKEIVISALGILGDDYVKILKAGIDNRWIDVYPSKGKRTGGYSSGSYDTEPYILLNYQNKYDDMSTLAHELGHSMHSYFSKKNNPYQYGQYSIFVAEVASTVNEIILAKYIIKKSKNKEEKLFILNRMMELFKSTIYRQTMFAEFEKKIYEMIEKDEPVSADILSNEYYKLNQLYFGKGVIIDDEIRYEWERIPHFYYNFYVYKYATGLSAASFIVDGLLDGSIKKEDYIAFLKCGDSLSPLDSLKIAGVDLQDSRVVERAVLMFNEMIYEFEKLYFS